MYHSYGRGTPVKLLGVKRMEMAKLLQFLEMMKAKFECGRNTRQRSASVEVSQKKFTGPMKGRFPETDDAVFTVL
jgi:hypothetical protein